MIDVPFETVKKAEINLTLCHKELMISNFFILFGIQDDQKKKVFAVYSSAKCRLNKILGFRQFSRLFLTSIDSQI